MKPGDQVYVFAPIAVNEAEPDAQITELIVVAVIVIIGETVIKTVCEDTQPLVVPVTE